MTLIVTIRDALYLQMAGWTREERMAACRSRKRFLVALDRANAAEPAPEDPA